MAWPRKIYAGTIEHFVAVLWSRWKIHGGVRKGEFSIRQQFSTMSVWWRERGRYTCLHTQCYQKNRKTEESLSLILSPLLDLSFSFSLTFFKSLSVTLSLSVFDPLLLSWDLFIFLSGMWSLSLLLSVFSPLFSLSAVVAVENPCLLPVQLEQHFIHC